MNDIDLFHDDCLEVMKQIPNKSVDLVLADPPYGTTMAKWDSVLNFETLWEQINRVTKPNSVIVLFGSEPFASKLRLSNIKQYKYDWVWVKRPVNFLNAKRQPLRKTERIMVFGGTRYYPQELIPRIKINKRSNSTETNNTHNLTNASEFTNYPTDVLEFIGERGLHPTQKPVALLKYLINTYSLPRETVLDFTMGSGSTGVACIETGRKFIGIEREAKYFDIAKERLNQ